MRKFESFDDFVVDVVGHEIALVSFRGLLSLLTRARGLSKSLLQSRVDYPLATSMSWALVRPGSSEFVLPGVRLRVRGGAMGRSPLDAVVPDAVLRSASSWKMAVSGKEIRESGWTVRNILDVLAGRVNRYYSLKADAEDEFDAARGEIEALTSKKANLLEENGELRRRVAAHPLVRRRRGNDGIGRGRESLASFAARVAYSLFGPLPFCVVSHGTVIVRFVVTRVPRWPCVYAYSFVKS